MQIWALLALLASVTKCFQLMPNYWPELHLQELYATNYRYEAYKKLLRVIKRRHLKVIVEANSSPVHQVEQCRNVGCPTFLLSKWSTELPLLTIFSVHSDRKVAELTKLAMAPFVNTHIYSYPPNKFIEAFPVPIDVLVLNASGDFRESCFRMLDGVLSAYPRLHKESVILMDGCLGATCDAAKIFLEHKGWKYEEEGPLIVMTLGSTVSEQVALQIPEITTVRVVDWERTDLMMYEWMLVALQKRLAELDEQIMDLDNVDNPEYKSEIQEAFKQLEVESNLEELGWKMIIEQFKTEFPKPREHNIDEARV
jgi:hypothetical protein